jgi:intergrase/recombinase
LEALTVTRTYRAVSNRMARRAGITPVGRLESVSRETAEPRPTPSQTEDGTEITYRELQAQAKARGIPGNQSAEELREALGYD